MMSLDDMFNSLVVCDQGRVAQIRDWAQTLFCGAELTLLSGLVGSLVVDRKIAASDVAGAIPHEIAELPWQGCEQQVFESIVTALRERGETDEDIREIVETVGAYIDNAFDLVRDPIDHSWQTFHVGPRAAP